VIHTPLLLLAGVQAADHAAGVQTVWNKTACSLPPTPAMAYVNAPLLLQLAGVQAADHAAGVSNSLE
jgi:hypothetical protein